MGVRWGSGCRPALRLCDDSVRRVHSAGVHSLAGQVLLQYWSVLRRADVYTVVVVAAYVAPFVCSDEAGDNGMVLGVVQPVATEQYVVFVNGSFPNTQVGCEQALFHSLLSLNFSDTFNPMEFTVLLENGFGDVELNVYAASCDGNVGLDYIIEFLNPGGFFQQEFSCTEQGMCLGVASWCCDTHSVPLLRCRGVDHLFDRCPRVRDSRLHERHEPATACFQFHGEAGEWRLRLLLLLSSASREPFTSRAPALSLHVHWLFVPVPQRRADGHAPIGVCA